MKPYLIQTLKELALLGAIHNKIEISSQELGNRIRCSQQTASRYLLELDKLDLIFRELGIKKQLIQITENGISILENEHLQLKQIFDLKDKIFFKGKIVSGIGEGSYYTAQKKYTDQFVDKLGFKPYPGTLNVEIEHVEKNKLRLLKDTRAIVIQDFKTNNRTFGSVRCFNAKINNISGAIVLPMRSHYSQILEFISKDYLRDELNLKDGDTVNITIELKKK